MENIATNGTRQKLPDQPGKKYSITKNVFSAESPTRIMSSKNKIAQESTANIGQNSSYSVASKKESSKESVLKKSTSKNMLGSGTSLTAVQDEYLRQLEQKRKANPDRTKRKAVH